MTLPEKAERPPLAKTLLPFAGVFLAAASAVGVLQLFFGFHLQRPLAFEVAAGALLVSAAATLRFGGPSGRINAALMLLPLVGGIFAYETYAALKRPRAATAAWLAGRPYDSRRLWERLEQERREDPASVAHIVPRVLLTHHLLEPWEPEAAVRTVRDDWGILVDGVRTLPLGNVANRRTVFCNESGTWAIYDSDERGFNNPRGLWDAGSLQIAILGDSFSQGACVAPEATTAARIRERYPRTLNLGMSANGPLMEYAGLQEYVTDLRPPIVLWVYYVNDLSDLEVEKNAVVLQRYLAADGFRQGLAARQPRIDAALTAYVEDLARRAPRRWPASFDRVGLTRDATPIWIQDLYTGEGVSSLAAFLRFDETVWYLSKRLLENDIYEAPPDYALFERILGKARDAVSAWNGRLYFVYLPALHHLEKRHRHIPTREPVLAIVQRLGIPLIDIHSVFLEHPDPERLRFHYGSHSNEAGYALDAKTILEALEQVDPELHQ